MRRRRFLGLAGAAGLAAGTSLLPLGTWRATAAENRLAGQRLKMPPLLDTRASGRFTLTAQVGESSFLGQAAGPTMGYSQAYLGPTLVMRNGPLAPTVENAAREPVTVHWHGMLVPGDHDGSGHSSIAPGTVWTPDMQISQRPTTAWYHSHSHGRTAPQVYMGLAGVIHVTDGRDDERGLPSTYGVDDLTLVLQDRRFDDAGRMIYNVGFIDTMNGFVGNRILVNGQAGAVAVVPRGIVRLRLVNGSNARVYTLAFNDRRRFHLIGTDGGLLTTPMPMVFLALSPGERVEILVDFADGPVPILMSTRGVPMKLLDFAVDDALVPRITRLPETAGGEPVEVDGPVVATRAFNLNVGGQHRANGAPTGEEVVGIEGGHGGHGGTGEGKINDFGVNGRPYDPTRIDFEVKLGTVERWTVAGGGGIEHPFHVHGVHFKVLRVGADDISKRNGGWKDTVAVTGETELLVRFEHSASHEHPYMLHCHILEHEDAGMMAQFAVT